MEVEARSGNGDKQSGVKNIRWKQVTDIVIHCIDRKLSLRSEHKVRQSGMRREKVEAKKHKVESE